MQLQKRVMGQQTISSGEPAFASTQRVMGQHRKSTLKSVQKKRPYIRKKIRIISDERIRLTIARTAAYYPKALRLVTAEVEVKKKMTRIQMFFDFA
ncbi:MAG: hypothetical protein MR727_05000 [Lentisphaeria bacterium]|nr:hypothetical protein [Lentisphaeria bacterium]